MLKTFMVDLNCISSRLTPLSNGNFVTGVLERNLISDILSDFGFNAVAFTFPEKDYLIAKDVMIGIITPFILGIPSHAVVDVNVTPIPGYYSVSFIY